MLYFEQLKPYLYVVFLQFGNAGLLIIAKAALNHGMNHHTFATYRNLIATLVMVPFALYFERQGRPKLTLSIFFKIIVLGFLEPVVDLNLYYAGMKYTTATFAIAICNIIPAMTFRMAWICRLEKVNVKKIHRIGKIIGTLVTIMIMTVVVGPSIGTTTEHQNQSTTLISVGDNMKGSIMIIAGCLSWSCFHIVQVPCYPQTPPEQQLSFNCRPREEIRVTGQHILIKVIHHAVHSDVTHLDTSDVYVPHTNEILVGKVNLVFIQSFRKDCVFGLSQSICFIVRDSLIVHVVTILVYPILIIRL